VRSVAHINRLPTQAPLKDSAIRRVAKNKHQAIASPNHTRVRTVLPGHTLTLQNTTKTREHNHAGPHQTKTHSGKLQWKQLPRQHRYSGLYAVRLALSSNNCFTKSCLSFEIRMLRRSNTRWIMVFRASASFTSKYLMVASSLEHIEHTQNHAHVKHVSHCHKTRRKNARLVTSRARDARATSI
jgi:hypothetical protein